MPLGGLPLPTKHSIDIQKATVDRKGGPSHHMPLGGLSLPKRHRIDIRKATGYTKWGSSHHMPMGGLTLPTKHPIDFRKANGDRKCGPSHHSFCSISHCLRNIVLLSERQQAIESGVHLITHAFGRSPIAYEAFY